MDEEKLMNPKEWLLEITLEVERDPTRWTQHAIARNAAAISTDPEKEAVCWCARGFISRDFKKLGLPKERVISEALREAGNIPSIVLHNDSLSSSDDFVSWFRRAAELCS